MNASEATRQFGNYEILARLGRGGMAEVFRARVLTGPREGQSCAIKRLLPELAGDPAYVDLFTSEADVSAALSHPNIVRVFDVGVRDEIYFIVMEFVDGRDLGQLLKRCRARNLLLPPDFGLHVARVLLDALAYAHEAKGRSGAPLGLIHSDVSPSNLFVSRTGEVKLGDFGVARGRTLMRLESLESRVEGKPYYLSPETLEGTVTQQTDLWAAAVVLYEALTLERPFQGEQPAEVFAAVRARKMVPVQRLRPDVPDGLAAVMARAFAKDPRQRFSSAAEFSGALAPLYDPEVGNALGVASMLKLIVDK